MEKKTVKVTLVKSPIGCKKPIVRLFSVWVSRKFVRHASWKTHLPSAA